MVAVAYMSMRAGSPQPMTQMKVGWGRARRAEGVMDSERVRRYSWQFWMGGLDCWLVGFGGVVRGGSLRRSRSAG